MDATALIQTELDRIEAKAEAQCAALLKIQDKLIAAHALVDLLKAHGAPTDMDVTICYQSYGADTDIFADIFNRDDTTIAAITAAGLTIDRIERGFNDETTLVHLTDYPDANLYVRASAIDWRQAA